LGLALDLVDESYDLLAAKGMSTKPKKKGLK